MILAAPMTEARFRKCQFVQNEGRGLDERTVEVAQMGSGRENQAVRLGAVEKQRMRDATIQSLHQMTEDPWLY